MEEVTEMGGWIPVKESWMKNPCLYDLRYLPPPLSALGAWERHFLTCLGGAVRGIMRESHLVFPDAVALGSSFPGPGHWGRRG